MRRLLKRRVEAAKDKSETRKERESIVIRGKNTFRLEGGEGKGGEERGLAE